MGSLLTSCGRAGRTCAFAVWVAACIVLGAAGLAPHVAALPLPPPEDKALREAASGLLGPSDGTHWTVVHVLLHGCGCSSRIIAALAARPPRDEVPEVVLVIAAPGTPAEPRLAAVGYAVRSITPAELRERFHLEAAPVFLVLDPARRVAHIGGYTTHRRAARLEDRDVLDALRAGGRPEPLPALGCGASAELRAAIDPLGLQPSLPFEDVPGDAE